MFRTWVPLLACVALGVSGCGGDEETSSTGGSAAGKPAEKRLTKEEYLARADQICVDTEDSQRNIQDRLLDIDRGNIRSGVASYIARQLMETRRGFDRLKRLSPPLEAQAQVDEYVQAVDELLDSYGALVKAVRKNDRTAMVRALRQGDRIDGEQEILADLLGLVDCRNIV